MDESGSLSIDILFTAFILLIIIIPSINLISDRFQLVDNSEELVEARSLAENIAGAIDQVYAGGNGHEIIINMPYHLNKNTRYKVTVNTSGVLVDLDGRKGLAHISPFMISNKPKPDKSTTVTLTPGNSYTIYNKKDESGVNWIIIVGI